jgi:hypothetical protein
VIELLAGIDHVGFFFAFLVTRRKPARRNELMNNSPTTIARQIAEAAGALELETPRSPPWSVTMGLRDGALAITLQVALTPAEQAFLTESTANPLNGLHSVIPVSAFYCATRKN